MQRLDVQLEAAAGAAGSAARVAGAVFRGVGGRFQRETRQRQRRRHERALVVAHQLQLAGVGVQLDFLPRTMSQNQTKRPT